MEETQRDECMSEWQIQSALLAAHNIALALGGIALALTVIAFALVVYPWIGGFGSSQNLKVQIRKAAANDRE